MSTRRSPVHLRFISIEDLPAEVLEPILAAIWQNQASRCKLLLLNRSFNAHFTPLLYHSVLLTSYDQLHRFVRYASDSTTSQARRTAVIRELTISLPPRPALQAVDPCKCCSSREPVVPKRLPIAAGPFCAKQFGILAQGYSLGDVVAMAALGGQGTQADSTFDSTFGLSELMGDASPARITLIPERDEDRRFLVISEAIRVCPKVESLHLDMAAWDWDYDMYFEVEMKKTAYGGAKIKATKPLPGGDLSYAECEDHRLVAALGLLQQLKHFTWTHSRDQTQPSFDQGVISKRKMAILAYGFDAMARNRATRGGGAPHPLESIRLDSPQCSSWRSDILPPCPTWRINLSRYCDPRCHSPIQSLPAPDLACRSNESPPMHVWYAFQLDVDGRSSARHKNKSLAQVLLGFGTHGHVEEANALNFPSLRHVSLLEPVGLDLTEYGRLMCQSPSDAKVRVTARRLCSMEVRACGGGGEAEKSYIPRLELTLAFWLSDYLVRMTALPIRDESQDEDEEKRNRAKRIKLEGKKKGKMPSLDDSQAIARLVGSSIFKLPYYSWAEDARDREGLFLAAVIEKLCSSAGQGDIVATPTRSSTRLAPSKPLWRLLSRIHLSARPLADRKEDGRALQHAAVVALIASADEHARRALQVAQQAEMPFAAFANPRKTAQSLKVL